jgi:indolepyruvate ferredoxin oxidoreductase alpha subunit
MKRLLSGNEAIALGAWEAGVRFASAYPGTPSTEILPNIAGYRDVVVEWASNEKVALDSAAGASFAGARSLAVMKHVGVNVAADSLMTLSYTGVGAGLVLVSADDPGAFSSQNEQDNRHYARFAKIPCLEPADSQEAKDYAALAFELSERFDTPVMLRTTTRIAHSKSAVDVQPPGERVPAPPLPPFRRQPDKFVMIPANARRRHPEVEARLERLTEYAETLTANRVEWRSKAVGIVTGSVAYQYVREVFPDASLLKLGMSYPLPAELIRAFAAQVERLLVVEELDPFWEEMLRAMGLNPLGKAIFPTVGELSITAVREGAVKAGLLPPLPPPPPLKGEGAASPFPSREGGQGVRSEPPLIIPPRPPALCPGCPHRAAFYAINKLKLLVSGDIGCYAIGVLPPFRAMDALISMGASLGMAHGMTRAGLPDKVVALIGDSTFFHAGLPALASIVYNNGVAATIILDNHTTGMTGGQDNPGTGRTLQGADSPRIDIEGVVRALGVGAVWHVDAFDAKAVEQAIKEAVAVKDRPSAVIVEGACTLIEEFTRRPVVSVDAESCNGCALCFRVGCPAILKSQAVDAQTGRPLAEIDPLLCTGCDVCLQVCPRHAIYRSQPEVSHA